MLKFLGLQLAGWTISNEEAVSEKETLYFASSFFSLVLDQLTLGWERGVPVDAWAPSWTWRCAPDLWWQGLVLSALPCCSISRSTAAENQVYGTGSRSGWWKTFFSLLYALKKFHVCTFGLPQSVMANEDSKTVEEGSGARFSRVPSTWIWWE